MRKRKNAIGINILAFITFKKLILNIDSLMEIIKSVFTH